jgi:predicted nuclease with TOPRIM domain
MFVLRSTYDALRARYERAVEDRNEAVKAAEEHVRQIARLSGEVDRLREAVRSAQVEQRPAEALAAENERLRRDVARLQQRLDDACGLNDPAVLAGQNWQQNRTDGARKGVTA